MNRTCLPLALLTVLIFGGLAYAQGASTEEVTPLVQAYLDAAKAKDTGAQDKILLSLYAERDKSVPVLLERIGKEDDPMTRMTLLTIYVRIKDMGQDAALSSLTESRGLKPAHFWMALLMSLVLFIIIVDLVRRKLLRIEYSWLWVLTGVAILALVLTGALDLFASIIGARVPQALFFSGVVFLTLINLHYSVAISRLSNQAKNLSQELAVLKHETEGAVKAMESGPPEK
jgi:hypothetical protein